MPKSLTAHFISRMGIVEKKIRAILSEKIAIMTRYVNFHAIYFCKVVSRDKNCKKNKKFP